MKDQIVDIVKSIPHGKLLSYGQIADKLSSYYDIQTNAWMVGRTLSAMPKSQWSTCPRWRVVNKVWFVSTIKLWEKGILQIQILEREWFIIQEWQILNPIWYI